MTRKVVFTVAHDLYPWLQVADALLHDKELLVGTCPIGPPSFSPAVLSSPFLTQEPSNGPSGMADAGGWDPELCPWWPCC